MKQETLKKLEMMNGCEINAYMIYESVVGVVGNKVWRDGEVIDTLDSAKKINALYNVMVEDELGDVSEIMAQLRAEFGGN